MVWLNPQISFWLCEYKTILFQKVCKSCKSKWLTDGNHQPFFLIYVVAVHSWWHLESFQQYIHPKLLIFQDSRIWCSRIFEAKISRNLLQQFKISLESDLISTQKLCFECVQTFGARICQLVNGMEENTRNTKVKNLVQKATNWIWTMQKTAFLGMLEAKVTSMWKSARAVSQKLGKLSGHQMDARVNTNFCTQIWKNVAKEFFRTNCNHGCSFEIPWDFLRQIST